MQIEIDNREVRKILSDTVKLQKTIGFEMMKKLKLREEEKEVEKGKSNARKTYCQGCASAQPEEYHGRDTA